MKMLSWLPGFISIPLFLISYALSYKESENMRFLELVRIGRKNIKGIWGGNNKKVETGSYKINRKFVV